MKRPSGFGRPLLGIVLAVFLCLAGWGTALHQNKRDMEEFAKIAAHMKTVCVGRFLVDVPRGAEVSLSLEMMDGFEVATREESEAAFRERVHVREADIRSRGPATDGGGGMVAASELDIPGLIGRTLVYGRDRGYLMRGERRIDSEFVSIEAHAHRGGQSFLLSIQVAREADAGSATALLARLQSRGADEVPGAAGFCTSRALFAEPMPPHKTEHIVMHVGLAGHPDIRMTFASLPGGGDDPGLLARTAAADAGTGRDELLRVTTLRTGRRTIHDMAGEEVLERVREANSATTFGFMWEARGVDNDPLRPFLSFELQAGEGASSGQPPAGTSLHEETILALWDAISSSIRPRPNQPPRRP